MKSLVNKHLFGAQRWIVLLLIGVLSRCQLADHGVPKPGEESADLVYGWYKFMTKLQLPVSPQPVVFIQNRAFAYIGIGLYESIQPGIKNATSLSKMLYQMPDMPQADLSKDYLWNASANAALASMFRLFLGSLTTVNKASIDSMEAVNYNRLRLTTSEEVLQRSQAFGRSVATAIYNWSTTDNFILTSEGYTPLNEPWAWVPTPPNFAAPVGANLQSSRPFLAYSLTATAPALPIPYSEDPSSEFYKAAKEVYDLGVTLTDEQKAIANWWADAGGSGVGVPAPYHILSIVTRVLEDRHAGLWKAVEVYAKTGIAIKDGPITTFRAKYQYNLLRPITYIRRHLDANWLSYLVNPPYPDYPSGLISNYGPVVQVLIREFGDIPVTDDAYAWRGLPARQFNSLSDLLAQAAVSRVYAGIHYRSTQNASIEIGKKLGDEIAKLRLVGP
ncbi:vanadium-dependent haloperoxidase [Larkinella soli]|uniref:vanadium-dependent haloperoxidase n=1 Tax=Larkinella soli TaxID=1770527 RepID=UPI000FFBCF26|nr:vanadium-dependent haloperoxidase [Larkinella soli]